MCDSRSARLHTRRRLIPRRHRHWFWIGALAAFLIWPCGPTASAAPLHVVGVADFYLAGPAPSYSGPPLGQAVADEVTRMLPKIEKGALDVIPRNVMREKQAAMGWQGKDGLSATRVGELAAAAGADHLIVGEIDRFDMERSTGTGGGGKYQVHTVIRVQVFDASQKRFTGRGSGDGVALGQTQSIAGQQALRQALAAALPRALQNMSVAHTPGGPSAPSAEAVEGVFPR